MQNKKGAEQNSHHLCFMLKEIRKPELLLTDRLARHYLELPKFSNYNTNSELAKWMCCMKNEGKILEDGTMDEQMKNLLEENPIFQKAHEKYLAFTMLTGMELQAVKELADS